ncbi:MAG: tetratricopeptide repeat protein [Nitrosomonas sp.]|uniref:tetratricopeptide repeat protein n=1 Tax=Nitrosomonas sp. TaxID=42353 RepID=UPI0032EF0E84
MANDDLRDPMQIGDYNKNIQIGNNNTIGITDVELAEQLGVGKVAVRNFLRLLDQQNVSIEEWDHTLRKLAERHKELERRAALLESDDPEVTSLQSQARQAIADIRYEIAEDFLEKAVKLDNAAAEKIKAIFLKRKRSAAENKALKAESLHTRFAFAEAIKAYEQAVILAQEGEDEEKITLYKNMLGCVHLDKGEYQKAVSYFEQALASDLKTYGEDHPSVARDRNNLGSVWCSLGEYRKAASYFEQALASNLKIYGEDHPSVAIDRNNLGLAWDSLGEYRKAVSYHEQALASDLKNYGEDHPSVARDLNNLGSAWYSLGEYRKAISYYEQALASDLKTYGEDHPSVTRDRNNLGLTWNSLGKR